MPSTARDRTQEFLATINTFQQFNRIETVKTAVNHNTSQPYIDESHRIHQLTLKIDATINDVSQTKLKQIEQLSKITNNWKDRQPEIVRLIDDVNEDLHHIDQNIAHLRVVMSKLNYNSNYHCASHHKALLNQLISKNEILKKMNRSTYDIAIASFKRQKKHRETYGAPRKSFKPKTLKDYRQERKEKKILEQKIGDFGQNNEMQMQRQRQMQLYDSNNINVEELRSDELARMGSSIVEVNGMMMELLEMVHGQGNVIRQIGGNVIKANENMEGVINELQKYLAKMTANEMLMLKVFALIIFFAIFFAIFIA